MAQPESEFMMAADCDHDIANEHCCDGMCCPDTCTCGPEHCENAEETPEQARLSRYGGCEDCAAGKHAKPHKNQKDPSRCACCGDKIEVKV